VIKEKKVTKKDQFEEFVLRNFTNEERQILKMERDKYKVIQAQIDRLSIDELRIIEEMEAQGKTTSDVGLKELATVQKLKAQAVKLLHNMRIDDVKYGLVESAGAEAAKKNAREVLEALSGECREREED